MIAIYKKELKAYFSSPIGYIFIGIFMTVAGLFFTIMNIFQYSSAFQSTLSNMVFIFMILVPVLTMRLLSEERKNKTDQLLLTAPVSITSIVLGKFLAASTVLLITLGISFIYPITIAIFGNPSWGELLAGYLGFFLLGCSLISVGVFMSSITENQVTSAVVTFGILFILYLGNSLISSLNIGWVVSILQWISVYDRFIPFGTGILSLVPVIYYISFCAIFLFLAIRSVERRRWSEG